MFERATQKLGLDKAIFINGHFKDSGEKSGPETKASKEEVEKLLREGMLGFVQNQDNNKNFFEGDVD